MTKLEEYKSTIRRINFLHKRNAYDFEEMISLEMNMLKHNGIIVTRDQLLKDLEREIKNEPIILTDDMLKSHVHKQENHNEKPQGKIKSLVRTLRNII